MPGSCCGDKRVPLTSQRYTPDVLSPDGASRIASFESEPWPTWTLQATASATVVHDLFLVHGSPTVVLRWRVRGLEGPARLEIRPLLAGRDYHALMRENDAFDFRSVTTGARVQWVPYAGVPAIAAASTGTWRDDPCWYRQFLYTLERERGLDDVEDLASPGMFAIPLGGDGEASLIFSADTTRTLPDDPKGVAASVTRLADTERSRRGAFPTPLDRAADAYVVRRGSGRTVIAGYPWFTDWGRDTFIALRGLSLASGGLDRTRDILLAWGDTVSEGMLPNRFPDAGETPEFNSVDASLWFVVAAGELQRQSLDQGAAPPAGDWARLRRAIDAILDGYARGTRYGIRADADGLLAAGGPGVQLTWMDAKVGDWVVTPRAGKPVEVQALWLNALWVGSQWSTAARSRFDRAWAAFERRFWNERRLSQRRRRCRSPVRDRRCLRAAEPDPRGRRTPARAADRRARASRRRVRRANAADAARSAVVDAGRRALSRPLRGRTRRARRRLSPGHGLAVADGIVRRGLAAGPGRHSRKSSRGARAGSWPRCSPISARPDSATSRRLPMATRRSRPGAAPSRRGRSGSCSGSTATCSRYPAMSSPVRRRTLPFPRGRRMRLNSDVIAPGSNS